MTAGPVYSMVLCLADNMNWEVQGRRPDYHIQTGECPLNPTKISTSDNGSHWLIFLFYGKEVIFDETHFIALHALHIACHYVHPECMRQHSIKL